MQLVAEQEFPDEMPPIPIPPPMTPQMLRTSSTASSTAIRPENLAYRAAVIGAINVLLRVLAVRVILLVTLAGSIALTALCLRDPDLLRLAALAIYCCSAVVPMIVMSLRRPPG
jgi:hypothetical protein